MSTRRLRPAFMRYSARDIGVAFAAALGREVRMFSHNDLLINASCERIWSHIIDATKWPEACGFADQSHFTKAYTRLRGISPGAWRRRQEIAPKS